MLTIKMSTNNFVVFFFLWAVLLRPSAAKIDYNVYKNLKSFRECLGKDHAIVCFKEKALDAINETILSDQPITFFHNMVDIEKNPQFHIDTLPGIQLPDDVQSRNSKLSDVLYEKIEELFKSRIIKFNMAPAFEQGNMLQNDLNTKSSLKKYDFIVLPT